MAIPLDRADRPPSRVPITVHPTRGSSGPDGPVVDQLMAAIARRDPNAFATLYRILAPHLNHELNALLGDPVQVRSVLWGSFVEVWWLARHRRTDSGTGRDWITTIVDRRTAEQRRLAQAGPAAPWQSAINHARVQQHHTELAALLAAPARPARRPRRSSRHRLPGQ
jgi:hypothetical protein